MVALSPGAELKVTIDRESKSGNYISDVAGTTNHINLGKGDYRENDVVHIRIEQEQSGNYFADVISVLSRPKKVVKENSINDTRSMELSTATVPERLFDPTIWGAPEISRSEPKPYEYDEDEVDHLPNASGSKPDMDSLGKIASMCVESFVERQEKTPRVIIYKRKWGMSIPVDVSKKP